MAISIDTDMKFRNGVHYTVWFSELINQNFKVYHQ